MKTLICAAVLVASLLSAVPAMARGNVTYTYVGSRSGGYYLFTGDARDNKLIVEPTVLNDGVTPGVLVSGEDHTTIDGEPSKVLGANLDIRFKLNGGADQIIFANLDMPNRRISFDGGVDLDTDSCFIYGCHCENIFQQWVDEIEIGNTEVEQDVTINKYIGTYAFHALDVSISGTSIGGELVVDGTLLNDKVTLEEIDVAGQTELNLENGHDQVELNSAVFAQLNASFGRGDDLLNCTGSVNCGAGSWVHGGSEGRRNRQPVLDHDTLVIVPYLYTELGTAQAWTHSNY